LAGEYGRVKEMPKRMSKGGLKYVGRWEYCGIFTLGKLWIRVDSLFWENEGMVVLNENKDFLFPGQGNCPLYAE